MRCVGAELIMITNEQFEESAVPHSWFLVADNLHEQAVNVRQREGLSKLTHYSDGEEQSQIDVSSRASFLLAGFAMENALKGLLVYSNPQWIENGKLNARLKSHSLEQLAVELIGTGLVDLSHILDSLKALEDGLESWARYPCGLNKGDTRPERPMTDALWSEYCNAMSELGGIYKQLLANYWKGSHAFHGKYTIEGDWLGNTE